MILSGTQILQLKLVDPLVERGEIQRGDRKLSYGLGPAGYDIRAEFDAEGKQEVLVLGPGAFALASTIEHFEMPPNVMGIVHDKSSWARLGLAVQNTVIEPGWRGYLTVELSNHSKYSLSVYRGDPIAQVVFHFIANPGGNNVYSGKYQDQQRGPQDAR